MELGTIYNIIETDHQVSFLAKYFLKIWKIILAPATKH